MKQSEKLDLILKALYQIRHDGFYYSIESICEANNIPVAPHNEVSMLAHRLNNDGYIKASFTKSDTSAILTSHGIEYCEEDSYSYQGHSIITNTYNLTISNSPNANIISGSKNVNIQIHNYSEIKKKISEVRDAIENNDGISKDKQKNLVECLDEVETLIDADKKPKFSFKQLTEEGSNIAGIGSILIELGRLIFGG